MHRFLSSLPLGLLCFILAGAVAPAAEDSNGETVAPASADARSLEAATQRDARMRWWREARFGLFIHWGVYAVPAGQYGDKTSYAEWIMHSAKIPVAEYRGFAARFNPTKYDPAAWARLAEEAGMRYIVITAKHHDGFALFPSRASAWNAAEASPAGRDLLGPLVDAAHARGLKIGFYYSQAQDWVNPGGAKARYPEGGGWDPAQRGNFDAYLRNVAVPQVREILTRYPIDILWWDTPTWMTPERAAPLAALLSLRPGLITNNRLGGGFSGDTSTPERFVPVTPPKGDWETCMTLNHHWGYNATDVNWKSGPTLIRMLAEVAAKGGNLLLNVGPMADGEFPPACVERLREVGRWLHANGEAIYGTTVGPFSHLSWGVATRHERRLYLHVWQWPADGRLRVPLRSAVTGAKLLATGASLAVEREPDRVVVTLPAVAPDAVDSVVVLDLGAEPEVAPLPSQGAKVRASTEDPAAPAVQALDGTPDTAWRAAADARSAAVEIDLGRVVTVAGWGFEEPDVWPRAHQKVRLEVKRGDIWQEVQRTSTTGGGFVGDVAPATGRFFRLAVERETGAPTLAEVQLYAPE